MSRKILKRHSVLVSAAIIGALSWCAWMTPRIDGRLAGRWECTTPTPGRQFVTLYLRRDGHGHFSWQEGNVSHVVEYPWAVTGSTLQIHFSFERNEYAEGIWRLLDSVETYLAKRRIKNSYESWRLLSIQKDELRMRQRSDSAVLTFRRVPSGLDP